MEGLTRAISSYNPYNDGRKLEAVVGKIMLPYADFEKLNDQEKAELPDKFVIQPTYMTEKAVGADCFASKDVEIPPGMVTIVPTGIKAKFHGHSEGLFPFIRSSLPKKKGLILANGVGVIEEDYYGNEANDGDIGFMFYNLGDKTIWVERFERVGQIVLMPIMRFEDAGRAGMARGSSGSTGQ